MKKNRMSTNSPFVRLMSLVLVAVMLCGLVFTSGAAYSDAADAEATEEIAESPVFETEAAEEEGYDASEALAPVVESAEEPVEEAPADEVPVEEPAEEIPAEAPAEEPAEEIPAEEPVEAPAEEEVPAEEPAEEEEPAQEEEASVAMPEASFNGYANGVSVKAYAPEGAFPEGTKMVVTAVAAADVIDSVQEAVEGEVKSVRAVDISFYTADGAPIEPAREISVTLTSGVIAAAEAPVVVHVPDEGAAEVVAEGGDSAQIAFASDAFSIYVIVDEEGETQTYRRTYNFEDIGSDGTTYSAYSFVNKASETVTYQVIKDGDELEQVGTPYHTGYDFDGWYLYENGEWGAKVDFDTPISLSLTADETVTVRAKYSNVYYLYFHENPADAAEDIILTTAVVPEGDSFAINDVTAPLPGAGVAFIGWTVGKEGTTVENSPYTPEANTQLYPLFTAAYWLRFVGNGTGASYTDAICVYATQDLSTVTKPANPTREGYTFAGWYTAAEGGSEFSWSGKLTADTPVYAHWTARTDVEYTVIYWIENADDDNYSYLTSKKLTGTADAATAAADLSNSEWTAATNLPKSVFTMQPIVQSTIKGDGSTVVNVFYDRNMITLTFHTSSSTTYVEDADGDYYRVSVSGGGGGGYGPQTYYYKTGNNSYEALSTSTYYKYATEGPLAYSSDGTVTLYTRSGGPWGGSTYTQSSARATVTRYSVPSGADITITAKYGADIHDQWPENPSESTAWYLDEEYHTYGDNTFVLLLTTMPGTDTDYYYHGDSGQYTLKMSYQIQNVDGSNSFTEYSSASFKSDSNSAYTTADDYSGITGFSLNAYSNSDATTIQGTNGGDPNATYNSSFNSSVKIGTRYSSGARSGNTYTLTLYYLRNKYDINFISNGQTVKTETGIYYGADISGKAPADYVVGETEATIDGETCVFQGWYDNEDCEGVAYTFGTMPAGHLTLYAKWEPAWYIVQVDPNGGELHAESQSTWFWVEYGEKVVEYDTTRNYVEDSSGTYYYFKNMTEENDRHAYYTTDASQSTDGKKYKYEEGAYVFLGWYDESGNPYDFQSGVTSNITIHAEWRHSGAYTVAYQGVVDSIGGNVTSPTESYADGAEITAIAGPATITKGYVFDGWQVMDGNGAVADDNGGSYYQPGDVITLNADNADSSKVIHIQAHYTKVDESNDPIGVTTLTLDANGGALTSAPSVTVTGYDAAVDPTISGNTVKYTGLPINTAYDLSKVTPTREGYELIGWNTDKAKADAGTVLYATNVVIGMDELPDNANTLYAVWAQPIEVEITGSSTEKPYNGEDQSYAGYTVTYKVGGQTVTDLPNGITATITATQDGAAVTPAAAKGKNVGTYTATVTATLSGSAAGYVIKTGSASDDVVLKITPLAVTVTITGNKDSKVYNGSEQKVEGYTATADNDLYDVKNVSYSGEAVAKGTDVKTYPMGLDKTKFSNSDTNFNVTFEVTDGELEITPLAVTVTIEGNKETKAYTGSEQKVKGYKVTNISDPLYKEDDIGFSGEAVAKGTDAATYPMGLTKDQFTNKNNNFSVTFTVTDGQLVITPVDEVTVTITGNKDSKVYNGSEQKVEGYTVEISNELYTEADFTFNGSKIAKGTNVGTYPMGLKEDQFTNNNKNFSKVTFKVTDGELKITPLAVTVTITGNKDSKVYNGSEQKVEGYEVKISDELYKESDFTFSGEAVAKGTEVDTYAMGLAKDQFANTNDNFTVTFEVTDGQLTITPVTDKVTVTIVGNNNTADYDGAEHTVTGYTATADNTLYDVKNVSFSGTAEAKRTEQGKTDMGLKEDQFKNTSKNFDNVTFVVTDGYQEINPIDVKVTIVGKTSTVTYDGKEHSVTGYEVTEISNKLYTEKDFTFTGKAEAKRTDYGKTMMGLTQDQFENNNKNFKTVTFSVTDGYQEIEKLAVTVTITGNKDSKVYNREEQKVEGYKVEISDKLYTEKDFEFSGEAIAKGTDVETYPMGLDKTQFTNKNDNFTVTFNVTDGELEITPVTEEVTVTITGNKDEKVYNGSEQKVEGYKVDISNTLYKEADFSFDGEAVAKGTDVKTYPMGLKEDQFTNNNKNFSKVTFKVTDGELTITPLAVTVTITGNKDSLVYNGSEQKVEGYKTEISNELYTEADFTFSGEAVAKGTEVDTYAMGLKEDQFANTNDNFTVTFKVTDGELEITPVTDEVTVEITGAKKTEVYDGTLKSAEGYEVKISNELYKESDFTFNGSGIASGVNAKTYPMGLEEDQFSNISKNFAKVTFKVTDGELTITKRPITLTSASADKVYDGTALTNDTVTISSGTLAEGDELVTDVTGSQTYVGSSDNEFTYKIVRQSAAGELENETHGVSGFFANLFALVTDGAGEEDVTDNYNVTAVNGKLTVTDDGVDPKKVITKSNDGKEYGLGDTVKFTIKVTNIYDETKTITIKELEGVKITGKSEFKDVKAGETVETTAEYTVTEEDILAGSFTNKATAEFEGVDTPYEGESKVNTGKPDGHVTITKTVTNEPKNGKAFTEGETIYYEIEVVNDGNLTITDLTVTDELTNETWTLEGPLEPGDPYYIITRYVVTADDVKAGSVTNVAAATGKTNDPDHPEPTVVPGEVKVTTGKNEEQPAPAPTPAPKREMPPKTGDTAPIALWLGMMAMCGMGLGIVRLHRKKDET